MKKIGIVFAALLMFAGQAAAQLITGDKINIREKIYQDLYVAGSNVTINAPVEGDLIVAGGTVTINDTITQDLLIAGGEIILNGYVRDDVRCAGGNIKISGDIGGDLIVAGGTLYIGDGVLINGNLLSGGGDITLNGIVTGNVSNTSGKFVLNGRTNGDMLSKGETLIINGKVGGNATLAATEIELGSQAQFDKDVMYWNKDGVLDFGNSLNGVHAIFDPTLEIDNGGWQYMGFASFLMVFWYLGTALLMIFLMEYLFNTTFKNAAVSVKQASLKSLGLGFLFLLGVPIAIFLLAISMIGIPVGILMLIGYVTILLFATSIVSVLSANWINNTYYQSSWSRRRIVFTAFGIFILLKLATFTPFIGPLIMLLLACMAFGSLLLNVKWKRKKPLALS